MEIYVDRVPTSVVRHYRVAHDKHARVVLDTACTALCVIIADGAAFELKRPSLVSDTATVCRRICAATSCDVQPAQAHIPRRDVNGTSVVLRVQDHAGGLGARGLDGERTANDNMTLLVHLHGRISKQVRASRGLHADERHARVRDGSLELRDGAHSTRRRARGRHVQQEQRRRHAALHARRHPSGTLLSPEWLRLAAPARATIATLFIWYST